MSSRDSERRSREEIERVLSDFGVPYTHTHTKKHPAVEFQLNGRRVVFTYSSSDPRAALNNRSNLRYMLVQAGMKPKVQEERVVQVEQPLNGQQIHHPTRLPPLEEDDQPTIEGTAEELLPADEQPEPETVFEDLEVPGEKTEEGQVCDPAPRPKTLSDVKIVTPRLQPSELLAIELDRDLVASKGTMLLIPLHRPNTVIDMSRELYEAMFVQQVVQPEPAQQPPVQPPPEPVAAAPEPAQEPEPPPEPEIEPEEDEPELWDRPVRPVTEARGPAPKVTRVAEGVSATKAARGRPPRTRKNHFVGSKYRETAPRSIDGISPQAGRILFAIVYVADRVARSTDITPAQLKDYLLEHDRVQVASRLPTLIQAGMAERGAPLVGKTGWHIRPTSQGRRFLRKLGHWPWLFDGHPVPSWVS